MAKQKAHIAYHNLRLNLNNEQHRRVHLVLANLNTDVHKSVNQFLIDATDAYISKLNGEALTNEGKEKRDDGINITRQDLVNLQKEIKEELLKEIIIILGSAFVTGKSIPMPEVREEKRNINIKSEEDAMADETTIGLASSWG